MARPRSYDVDVIDDALIKFAGEERPITVRQAFYHLVSRRLIDKTEAAYKNIVVKRLGALREDGRIPYEHVADFTRSIRKATTFSNLSDGLLVLGQQYRRDRWQGQRAYVQIWLEKDALAGVLGEATREYAVPLLVTRGFSSKSFLHQAAQEIESQFKQTFIYYFGDHDPSGDAIPIQVQNGLISHGVDFEYDRVAVTQKQIDEMGLPTRPTKVTDTRAKNWDGDDSVEVDAIPPSTLRQMVRDVIERHIDWDEWEKEAQLEEKDKERLEALIEEFEAE